MAKSKQKEPQQATIRWENDAPLIHRLYINDQYIGKLHFTVVGDTVTECQFVRSTDHQRIPISMTRLMLQAAKYEVLSMIIKPHGPTEEQAEEAAQSS